MDLNHLIPDEVRSVWMYYQPTKDCRNVLHGQVTWDQLCAWYFTWGHYRMVDSVQFPKPVIEALFSEVELYPGIRCSALAASVIRAEFDKEPQSIRSARKALGWYYLFRVRQFGDQFDFIINREVALASKIVSANSDDGPALELVLQVRAFAQDSSDLEIISGESLVTLGWLFNEKGHPFFTQYWRENADFFLSDRVNSVFDLPEGVPFIVACVERYRQRMNHEALSSPLDWKRGWLNAVAPDLAKQSSGFLVRGGVNLVGAATADSGIGEDVRLFAQVLSSIGVPHSIIPFPPDMLSPTTNSELADRLGDCLVYDVTLLCLPPEELLHLQHVFGKAFFRGRYNVGYFPVELRYFPEQLKPALDLVQEVWCMSEFVRAGLPPTFANPAVLMPAVIAPFEVDGEIDREALGVPKDRFMFLCCFDALSYVDRKNPLEVIEAFRVEFGDSKDVCLVIKTMNLDKAPPAFAEKLLASARENVQIIDALYSRAQTQAIIATSDALVSLHRSEGFGRVLAEAMSLGVPVIASGYSGSLDYANADTAFIVEGEEVDVPEGAYPYGVGNKWFQPSQESASRQMRTVFQLRGSKAILDRCQRGRMRLSEHHSISAMGARVETRLTQIMALRGAWPEKRNLVFDSVFYAGMSPELNNDSEAQDLFLHYCRYGFAEGRVGTRSLFNEKHWRAQKRRSRTARLAVVIHCYYADQIRELGRYLENLDFMEYDVFVNLVSRPGIEHDMALVRQVLPKATLFIGENRGRDIGGLLNVLGQIDRQRYELCLVLHTKSSPQNKGIYAGVWKDDLIGCLIRDPATAYRNIARFSRAGSRVGAIGSLNWRSESMCGNANHVEKLFKRFGISGETQNLEYISGSMMFIRMPVLERLVSEISLSEFESCDGKPKEFFIDGQLEHALERVLGSLIRDEGLTIEWVQ